MTDPKTISAELAAAKAAIKAFVNAKIPFWARSYVTDEEETNLAAAIVDAVDAARDAATKDAKP